MSMAVRTLGADETVSSKGYVKALAAASKRARLYMLRVFNKGAADCYIQVHDSAGAPTDMSSAFVVLNSTSGGWSGDQLGDGLVFTKGIYAYASTTPDTLSAIAGNDILFTLAITKTRV